MPLTEILRTLLDMSRLLISGLGAMIVIWGVAEAAFRFVRLRTVQHSSHLFVRASSIRERLGVHLLLALDIFIGADLITTVSIPIGARSACWRPSWRSASC